MTARERWSISSTWQRVGQIAAAFALLSTLVGAGALGDAWATKSVTEINQRVVPPIVRAAIVSEIGDDLDGLTAAIEQLSDNVADMRAEQYEQRAEMRDIRRAIRAD